MRSSALGFFAVARPSQKKQRKDGTWTAKPKQDDLLGGYDKAKAVYDTAEPAEPDNGEWHVFPTIYTEGTPVVYTYKPRSK